MEVDVSYLSKLLRVLPFIEKWGQLIIAGIALILSIVSLIMSVKAQKLQNKVNELELIIKKNEVKKITKEQEDAALIRVEARVIYLGQGKHRLKVWNSGNAPAYNVKASIEKDSRIILISRDMQPYDELLPKKSYELALVVADGSASKFRVTTEWQDADGNPQTYSQICSIQ